MKSSKFTEEQIVFALKQAETGTPVKEVIRKMGITGQTYYRWKKKYGGMMPSDLRRLRQLEEENHQLKNWWQILAWINRCCRMYYQKSFKACSQKRDYTLAAVTLPYKPAPGMQGNQVLQRIPALPREKG